jgi:LPS export ABC transporter protein LptC
MKKIQFILIAIAFFTVILVIVSLVRNNPTPENSKPMENLPPEGVAMQLSNVHYEQIDQYGIKEWALDAQSAQVFDAEKKIALKSLEVIFFSGEDKGFTLVADHGELYTDSKDVTVSGNVVTTTDQGFQIESDSLQYNSNDRTISTTDKVTLRGNNMVMRGTGMIIDVEKETLSLLEEVKASEQK